MWLQECWNFLQLCWNPYSYFLQHLLHFLIVLLSSYFLMWYSFIYILLAYWKCYYMYLYSGPTNPFSLGSAIPFFTLNLPRRVIWPFLNFLAKFDTCNVITLSFNFTTFTTFIIIYVQCVFQYLLLFYFYREIYATWPTYRDGSFNPWNNLLQKSVWNAKNICGKCAIHIFQLSKHILHISIALRETNSTYLNAHPKNILNHTVHTVTRTKS